MEYLFDTHEPIKKCLDFMRAKKMIDWNSIWHSAVVIHRFGFTQFGMTPLSLRDFLRLLWFETWWKWHRPSNDPLMFNDFACHYFNLCEAAAWFIFSILVLRRWWLYRRSVLEIGYAIAFFLFGVSDVVEAWVLTSWLLWWKVVNLTVLFFVRKSVMRQFYPDRRLF